MAEKAQFMISLPVATRDRLDALRIVLDTSRADIGRTVLERYVHLMERSNTARLERLHKVAGARGYPNWNSFVQDLIKASASNNSTNRGQRLPTLEELEMQTFGAAAHEPAAG